jgi:N-acetylmuramoyl-L-alanine amidase
MNSLALKTTADNAPKNKIVILDAGHGGEDPGAVSDNGTREKEINFYIASKVKESLEAQNFKIIMTREDDTL